MRVNVYQMYVANGNRAGFCVRRSSWKPGSYARVVSVDGHESGLLIGRAKIEFRCEINPVPKAVRAIQAYSTDAPSPGPFCTMLQLDNRSPLAAMMFSALDPRGRDMLIIVIKASFELRPSAAPRLTAAPRPITLADEYWGAPTSSSLRYPGEVHLPKPGTDVVVNGEACAPRGRAVVEHDLLVRVGDRSKHARVFGDRAWVVVDGRAMLSRPQPFVRMPLVWERAFGGPGEPRNPIGVGLVDLRGGVAAVHGQPLPNIEDPRELVSAPGQTPTPMGFGAIAATWAPRVGWVGSYDERWLEQRAPLLPEDFDARHFQVASPGLCCDPPLRGGEPLSLRGFDPEVDFELALPELGLDVEVRVRGTTQPLASKLDTVLLEPSERCLDMSWRASLVVDRLLEVERVELGLASLVHAEGGA